MTGAILTQNANWKNVARAIANLKKERLLDAAQMLRRPAAVRNAIRPSGFYRVKTRYLLTFARYYHDTLRMRPEHFRRAAAGELRHELLTLKGIGPETADSMLLYALNRPVFVVDAYTRRILSRCGVARAAASYQELQDLGESAVGRRAKQLGEFHALLVRLGKEYCHRHDPRCDQCPLRLRCARR